MHIVAIFLSCADNGDSDHRPSIQIDEPTQGEIVLGTLTITAHLDTTEMLPDDYHFEFTFDSLTKRDPLSPFTVSFDVSAYPDGEYSALATVIWDDEQESKEVGFTIEQMDCVLKPVVVSGDTVPENRIHRFTAGCIRALDLSGLEIDDDDCLQDIAFASATLETLKVAKNAFETLNLAHLALFDKLTYLDLSCNNLADCDFGGLADLLGLQLLALDSCELAEIELPELPALRILRLSRNLFMELDLSALHLSAHLQELYLDENFLLNVNLSALSGCSELAALDLYGNQLHNSIDLTTLADCRRLQRLHLNSNSLSSIDLSPLDELPELNSLFLSSNYWDDSACDEICRFSLTHPACIVISDCDCGQKGLIRNEN